MPFAPKRSSSGFVQLPNANRHADGDDIPLTQVPSHASAGIRQRDQGMATAGMEQGDATDEKNGFFHGRRRAKGLHGPTRSDSLASEEISLNAMGKLYTKVISSSALTRYLVYVVPVALLLAVPLAILPMTGHDKIPVGSHGVGPPIINLFIWIELAWVTLWLAKMVAHLLPPIFMFFCGVVSSGTRKYATVIRALEIPLSLYIWALASWMIFKRLVDASFDSVPWVDAAKRALGATFASSAVFLTEKAIVQLISITYHQRSFANRIKESKREIHLLGLMYDASRTLFPMYCPEFAEEDYIINDSIDMMLGGQKGHTKKGSTTNAPLRFIGNVGRVGDKVTSVFGNLASEITGKQVFNPNSAHSVVVEALEKIRTSEALAQRIWLSFVVEGKDALYVEDIIEVLGAAKRAEAEECFAAIDADSNGDISLDEMIRKLVEISKERKAITNSMKDISQALGVFDKVLLFIVSLAVIFIFLAFFQSSFITTLATAGTTLLSMSFVFAVTTQEFLGSCIFLFVKHPYDVGDRVDITGPEKEQLVVEKISLLYTVFNRIDRMQVVQVPNIILNNLWIENVSRSKAMKEVIEVNVSYDTTFEDIELLRLEMERFVRHGDNSRDFLPDIIVSVAGVGDLDKLTLRIAIMHKSNWHNEAVRATRRSKFMCALTLALKRVPIYAPGGGGEALGGPGNPSYNVTVSDPVAASAREKAEKDKNALRLVPVVELNRRASNATKLGGIDEKTEMRAAQDLNAMTAARARTEDWGYNRDDDQRTTRGDSMATADLNSLHAGQTGLQRQASGRRKAGDVPSRHPSIQVTQHNPASTLDEEAQIGSAYDQTGYPNNSRPAIPPLPAQTPVGLSGSRPRGVSISRPGNSGSANDAPQRR